MYKIYTVYILRQIKYFLFNESLNYFSFLYTKISNWIIIYGSSSLYVENNTIFIIKVKRQGNTSISEEEPLDT